MRFHRGYSLRLAVMIGIFLGMMSGLTSPQAATFNIPAGDVDALIAAINSANANGEDDTINLAAGTYTLTEVDNDTDGPNGLPSIVTNIRIRGTSAVHTVIERHLGPVFFRIVHVSAPGSLTLNNITIAHGVFNGISNYGELYLDESIIRNNGTTIGGITNAGFLRITNSDIINNTGTSIYNYGILYVRRSSITGNSGNEFSGFVTAGIDNDGTAVLDRSNISNNSNSGGYGGSCCAGIRNNGSMTAINSTISGNRTDGGSGAIAAGVQNGGSLYLINTTITNNEAYADEYTAGGGIQNINQGIIRLVNTIIAGNTANDDADCNNQEGQIISLGHNLVGSGSGCPSDGPGDIVVNPAEVFTQALGPLQNNGGPTETHALLAGSPAIDAGEAVCTDVDDNPLTMDQRGALRPVDGNSDGVAACDIGAFELQMETPPVPTSPCAVVTTDGEMTGFPANGEEVKLPKDLHKSIDWATTQDEYQLSLYTWYGSTTPFAEAQGRLDLEPDTQVKKVKCEAISAPEPSSPCEIVTADGDVMGFPANGQEVKLPKELHKSIDWATTQDEYQLSLYTWYGSTTPFAEAQGRLDLEPDTQVKKVKCEAISAPEPSSPCEIVTADGEVMGFPANGQEVKLPKELHKSIGWATTQDEYRLLLYTWYGSTTPFAEAQGRLDLEPDTQVKKVKCEAL